MASVSVSENPTTDPGASSRRPWYAVGLADVLLIFYTLSILSVAQQGLLDDPGLGWNLRTADLMAENRGFIYQEQFCYPTAGRPCVTQAWLGDILLRGVYGWAGLNGLAVLMALCVALTLRLLYTRMTQEGVHCVLAAFWTYLAALGTAPSWVIRPNMFTLPALALVAGICERYHTGAISARKTLWLLPIFLLWPNMHGGFLAGAIVLAVTYLVECATAVAEPDPVRRGAARGRLAWWTRLGVGLFAVTLINPYGFGLYRWNLGLLTDPFIQTQSTVEWRPPNYTAEGWFPTELLVLLFPTLAVLSRRRVSHVALALAVVFLHFALTATRYNSLWVVVVVPTLGALSSRISGLERLWVKSADGPMPDGDAPVARPSGRSPCLASFAFAGLLLLAAPLKGEFARHNQDVLPSESLDQLLKLYRGERVFHAANWGGYLTWHGWDLRPRFKTWIDDRIDVHGRQVTEDYYAICAASPDWEEFLGEYRVEMLCLPPDTRLVAAARKSGRWRVVMEDGKVVIFRRVRPATRRRSRPAPIRRIERGKVLPPCAERFSARYPGVPRADPGDPISERRSRGAGRRAGSPASSWRPRSGRRRTMATASSQGTITGLELLVGLVVGRARRSGPRRGRGTSARSSRPGETNHSRIRRSGPRGSRSPRRARARRSGRATRPGRSCRRGPRAASCRPRSGRFLTRQTWSASTIGTSATAPRCRTTSRSAIDPSARRDRLQAPGRSSGRDRSTRRSGARSVIGRRSSAHRPRRGSSRSRSRIVRTGQGASRTIRSATEPSRTWLEARSGRGWRSRSGRSSCSRA